MYSVTYFTCFAVRFIRQEHFRFTGTDSAQGIKERMSDKKVHQLDIPAARYPAI